MNIPRKQTRFSRAMAGMIILALVSSVTLVGYAAGKSHFVGNWVAVDLDGSAMKMAISRSINNIFKITWTDQYISYCDGGAGIIEGIGWLDPEDADVLVADLQLKCFTTAARLDIDVTLRYIPNTNILAMKYSFGAITIWQRPGRPQAPPPALNLRLNYGHDWVESFYEAGHMVWITLTDSEGNLKATSELFTEPNDSLGGDTGFHTGPSDWLDPDGNPLENPPDIQPNDWVYGWVDNGASSKVQIGEITGKIDLANDSVAGTISAAWFTDPVSVECLDWGSGQEPPYNSQDGGSILADGIATFDCSWSGEWDIQPGQTVGVGYSGPDGNWVANDIVAPNPHISASESGDFFWVSGFYPGTLDLAIYESADENATELWSGQQEATDLLGITYIGPDIHGLDLMSGNYVTVSDGTNQKGIVLETLTELVFSPETEIMAGTAPPGMEVMVFAGLAEWQQLITVQADPETGIWLADFSTIDYDIIEDMRSWSYARINDDDGDSNESAPPPANVMFWVTFTEDELSNDGACSLREAILSSNFNTSSGDLPGECPGGSDSLTDVIVLQAGTTYSLDIDRIEDNEWDGDLDITDNPTALDLLIMVTGDGMATISQEATVDDRVLENQGANVYVRDLILTGGVNEGYGGGLLNNGGVIMDNCQVNGNAAGWDGGGIWTSEYASMSIISSIISANSAFIAGGIMNKGVLTLTDSMITGNRDDHYGGGIYNEGTLIIDHSVMSANTSDQGGALYNTGTATIRNATLVGGTAFEDANVANVGGGLFSSGILTVTDSLVTGNRAYFYGGGLFNSTGGTLTINNTTVSNNNADQGGGLHNKEGSTAFIENGSIFSGNYAVSGGGGIQNWGTISITGSVLRDNVLTAGILGGALQNVPSSTASITASCIIGNGDFAVHNSDPILMNATGNWWGDPSGPTLWNFPPRLGDSVSDNVDFSGWLEAAPDICSE